MKRLRRAEAASIVDSSGNTAQRLPELLVAGWRENLPADCDSLLS
ncbi:hypothetical protein [Paenibacillus aquistagni]|nr:hypothetical protein [Paenibacillus aquistagni]